MSARGAVPGQGDGPPWAFPPPWVRQWRKAWLPADLTAGIVVAVMLVPQSLAYAMVAGLPPQAGLLASILPLLAYAVFGSSSILSVGPAAITSLMVAQSLSRMAAPGSDLYVTQAAVLALGSGALMLALGAARMGFLSQLLSRPVVQGFTVASAVLILAGQLAPLVGWSSLGLSLPDMAQAAVARVQEGRAAWHPADVSVGLAAMAGLYLGRAGWQRLGRRLGWQPAWAEFLTRLWPLAVLIGSALMATWLSHASGWQAALVGDVALGQGEGGHAARGLAGALFSGWSGLLMPMLLISLVTFVSSMSVAQTFALKRGERVDADRELLGLGLANVGGAILGGMPVAGGLSRSVVNEAAGARSPLSGVLTAAVLVALLLAVLPWLAWLPKAALAAVIIVAVAGLIEFRALQSAWRYDRTEAGAFLSAALGVVLVGFEAGIVLGMAWSLGIMIWRHSQPHVVEVGRLPGTEHFRNIDRHSTQRLPGALMVRIDESLDFTNVQRVEQRLGEMLAGRGDLAHVVLLLSAVNHIDHTAVQTLVELDEALAEQGMTLSLAEVKGPVMDRLVAGGVAARFEGRTHLSAQRAWDSLSREAP